MFGPVRIHPYFNYQILIRPKQPNPQPCLYVLIIIREYGKYSGILVGSGFENASDSNPDLEEARSEHLDLFPVCKHSFFFFFLDI